jgi:hypothetical protein
MRLDRATRGKWGIPDGKVSQWNIFIFGPPKVVAPTSVG